MRSLLVSLAVAAALAIVVPAASAYRLPYAVFKVSVTGTQTTQVTGADECQDEFGTVAPATASSTASFKTKKPKRLEFAKGGKVISVVTPRGPGNTKIEAAGTLTRQSGFALNGTLPPVCAGGQPNPGCGATQLTSLQLLVQGGVNAVNLQAMGVKPKLGACPVPVSFPFPELVQGDDNGTGAHIVKYSEKLPSSFLNPHKHVVLVHGTAIATNGKDQEGAIHVTSGTTTLKFTMRLVRVPLR